MSSDELSITLVNPQTGQSEFVSLPRTLPVQDVTELASALFGAHAATQTIQLFKDGQGLTTSNNTLQQAGIGAGDVLVVMISAKGSSHQQQQQRPRPESARPPPRSNNTSASSGGLDFSNLLASSSSSSNAAAATSSSSSTTTPGPPVYISGMSVEDAMSYNPHPQNIVTLLQTHEHLFKELRHHQPHLAQQLEGQPRDRAIAIWREQMVKGGIRQAMQQTQHYHLQETMRNRLQRNPNDTEAKEYFAKQERQTKVNEQYRQMMEEYPESLGRVLMLYVPAKINGHEIAAFCDSGAQMTILSKRLATQVGLADYIDTRFAGVAAGVGTGKILGRIHILQLQLGHLYYPCSVSVMDDPPPGATEMPFLLGLDMMKRHTMQLDLQHSVLRLWTPDGTASCIEFLHEKDLDASQGGTKGFDAEQANQEFLQRLQQQQEKDDDDKDDQKPKKPDAPSS